MEKRLRYPYWRIDHEVARALVRVTRTAVPFPSLDMLVASIQEASVAIDSLGRSGLGLLVDLRLVPMRTDPAFEQAMSELRPRLLGGMRKVAVLVGTPLGIMQVARHQREGTIEWMTFTDEAAALEHLRPQRPSNPGM